jgi:putative ABC transport system ATP-binding protein
VLTLLLELTRNAGKTLVIATHNPEIIPLADRVCRIHEGKLIITMNAPITQDAPRESAGRGAPVCAPA